LGETTQKAKVIAVGHTPWKMSRLMAMLWTADAGMPFDVFTVFNGGEGFDANLNMPNDLVGRDIRMYKEGLDCADCDWAFFLNDDVVHMDPGWLGYAATRIEE